jgi:hypothetical protein
MSERILTFNGIDMDTGEYLHSPLTPMQLKALATGETGNPDQLNELKEYWESRGPHYGMVEGRDYKRLDDAGWGVIFAAEPEHGVYEALKPLLDLRKEQASAKDEALYKEYKGLTGHFPGDTKRMFLRRNGAAISGVVDPKRMPYYLMIVGDPESIPYEFQYQLDVQYGVGRIHFDRVEDYAQYAASVVAAETGRLKLPRRAAFFGVQTQGDPSTELSARFLVDPLREAVAKDQAGKWDILNISGEQATKARLGNLLGGSETPAFLFTASHGNGGRNGSERQLRFQGSLVCQDWPGPGSKGDMTPYSFAGEDLGKDARLGGTIAMMFACYGAGTPKYNEFRQMDKLQEANQIAPHAFVAALPKAMLSHPNGGALAVIGHVERAWTCSFMDGKKAQPTQTFESSLKKILDGYPVGYSTEDFNSRYAELSTELLEMMPRLKAGMKPTDEFIGSWTENYDARNYSLIGDPGVRMAAVESNESAPVEREAIRVNFTVPVAVKPGAEASAPLEIEVRTNTEAGLDLVTRIAGNGELSVADWAAHRAAVESAWKQRNRG